MTKPLEPPLPKPDPLPDEVKPTFPDAVEPPRQS